MTTNINEQALLERKLFDGMAAGRKDQLKKLINRLASYKSKNNGAGLTQKKRAELAAEFSGYLNDIPDASDLQKIKNTIAWLNNSTPVSTPASAQSSIQPADSNVEVADVPSTAEIRNDQEEQQGEQAADQAVEKPNPYAKWDLGLKSPREILADLEKPKITAADIFADFIKIAAATKKLRLIGVNSDEFQAAAQSHDNVYIAPVCTLNDSDADDTFTVEDVKQYVSKIFAKEVMEIQKKYDLTEKTPFAVAEVKDDEGCTVIAVVFDARNY